MEQSKWNQLDNDEKRIIGDWLEERYPIIGMQPKNPFDDTKACSACGRKGFVPKEHRFLCVFCWVTAPFYIDIEGDYKTTRNTVEPKAKQHIPIGIEGTPEEPEVYSTIEYSSATMTQEELQALIP